MPNLGGNNYQRGDKMEKKKKVCKYAKIQIEKTVWKKIQLDKPKAMHHILVLLNNIWNKT